MALSGHSLNASPESAPSSVERPVLAVTQPAKIESLFAALDAIEKISESVGEHRSGDLGTGGAAGASTQGDDSTQVSARQAAIENLPPAPLMQKKLKQHIRTEVKILRKQVHRVASLRSPGSAHKVNLLYTRIRRLNGLLAHIVESSLEVLQRLFIRVFIDKQPLL